MQKKHSLGAAYIRYSSAMQDDSFSLDAQLRQIKARAAADGIEVVKVYADPAISAYKNRYRPGITQMLDDSRKGVFDLLYVHKVDRLARRLEWAIDIVKQLQQVNITLKAVEQNFDLDTPEGKLMFHLLGSLGEFYSDNLSKETNKGKFERAQQGYNNGWVPWGYTTEKIGDRKMGIIIPELKDAVHEMFERYATGTYYDQDIAKWLTASGYTTRFGRPFTKDAVRDLLQNQFYIGLVSYSGAHAQDRRTRRRGGGQFIPGVHEPLIEKELFEKCQKVRQEHRRKVNTNQVTRRVYLLSGIIMCKDCKKRLRSQSAKYGRYYRDVSAYVGAQCKYHGKSVRADVVEPQIAALMESLALPDDWQAALQEILNTKKDEVDPAKEKARIKNELRRMREAFKRGLYADDEHAFWREVESLQMKLDALEQLTPQEVRQAGTVLANLQQTWHAATEEEKQELCEVILSRVEYDFETGKITKVTPKPEYEVLFQVMGKK